MHKTLKGRSLIKSKVHIIRRFVLGFIIISITLLGILISKVALNTKTQETNILVAQTHDIHHEAVSLKVSFQNIILHERGYLLTGDEQELSEINDHIVLFFVHHRKLSALTKEGMHGSENLHDLMQVFLDLHESVVNPMLQMRSLIEVSPESFVQGQLFLEKFYLSQAYTNQMLSILDRIEQEAELQLANQQKSMDKWEHYNNIFTFLAPVVILVVTLLTSLSSTIRFITFRREQEAYQKQLKESRDSYSNVIEGANVGTWEWDIYHNTLALNDKFADLLGYKHAELEPISLHSWLSLVHPDDYSMAQQLITEVQAHGREAYSYDLRLRCKDGSWLWMHTQGKVISWTEDGQPFLMTGTLTDINSRKTAQLALEKSEEYSRLLLDSMTQGLAHCELILDKDGKAKDVRFLKVNPIFEEKFGAAKGSIVGKTLLEVMPEAESFWIKRNAEVAQSGRPQSYEAYSAVMDKYYFISAYCPYPNQFACIIDDITDRKRLEQMIFIEKELFETTLLSVGDAVISTDSNAKVKFMNRIAEEFTGWRADEAKGRPFSEIFRVVSGTDRTKSPDPVAQALEKGETVTLQNDTILIARDGVERYIDDSASPIMDSNKTIMGVVLVFRDSTEKKREQDKILQLSYHDPLTGLFNRRYYEQVKKTVDSEPYYPLTLVLGDVNGLKLTNDAFGHDAGDRLLKKVASVFRKTCREGDIVTRLGGDEFILLLPKTDALSAKVIVDRLNAALQAEEIRGLKVSVSFGYSVKHSDPTSFEETFKLAEDNMYIEKLSKSSAFKKHAIDTLLVKQFELNQWEKEHSLKVGYYSKRFAQEMGFSKEEIWQIERGASLHDLGKIAIDESILSQKEGLTHSQWLELKRHPEIGYTILRSVGEYAPFAEYVLYHHERWDGSGYPQKLKGTDIPEPARMIAIVDSYVAMISDRAYKQALTPQQAIAELYACSGTQFDPDLVPLFVEKVLYKDHKELAKTSTNTNVASKTNLEEGSSTTFWFD